MKANTLILILSLMLASFLFTSCEDFFENMFSKSSISDYDDDDEYSYGADGFTYKDIRDDDYRGEQKYRKISDSNRYERCDDDYDDDDDDYDDDKHEECNYFRYVDDD